jgi:hypothetical protein
MAKWGKNAPKKGAKWRLLREHATLLVMTQLLYYQVVGQIIVEKSAERQSATTIYSLGACVEIPVSQNFEKAQRRSIS